MIGCARNQKFVPWDDDVDILFEKQYEAAVGVALDKHLSDKYIIEHPNTVSNHKQFYRVIKRDTCMIRDLRDQFYQGIDVELFPAIDVPDPGMHRHIFYAAMRMFILVNEFEYFLPTVGKRFVNRTKKIFDMVFDKMIEKSECSCMAPQSFLFFREVFPKDLSGIPVKRPFEGTEIYFPEKFEEYLTINFGQNYMTPPPKESCVPTYLVMDTENGPEQFMDEAREIRSKF